jgi:hypothetical protein
MSDDYDDDLEGWDDGADYSAPFGNKVCHHCGEGTVGEQCGFCGNDLCPACFEMGAGFCHNKHTQEQIDAYEDAIMPPQTSEEAAERQRQRTARNELQAMGILPKP